MGNQERRLRKPQLGHWNETADRRRTRQLLEDRIDSALPVAAAAATLALLGTIGAMAIAGGALAALVGASRPRRSRRRLVSSAALRQAVAH